MILSRGQSWDRSGIHPGDECFHAVIRLPAETDPARGMPADAPAVIGKVGKNEKVMRLCLSLSAGIIGRVMTQGLDPVVAQQVVGRITSTAP
jgi:hypothetical protein